MKLPLKRGVIHLAASIKTCLGLTPLALGGFRSKPEAKDRSRWRG